MGYQLIQSKKKVLLKRVSKNSCHSTALGRRFGWIVGDWSLIPLLFIGWILSRQCSLIFCRWIAVVCNRFFSRAITHVQIRFHVSSHLIVPYENSVRETAHWISKRSPVLNKINNKNCVSPFSLTNQSYSVCQFDSDSQLLRKSIING